MVVAQSCPNCGKPLNEATAMEGDMRPKPGDLTVCLYCSHLMAFDDTMRLRELNDPEIHSAAGDADVLAMMNFTALYREHKAKEDAEKPKNKRHRTSAGRRADTAGDARPDGRHRERS